MCEIWRCWVIWGRNWKVTVLPVILTVVGTVFSVLADFAQIKSAEKVQNVLLDSKLFIDTGTIYLSLSFATTLVVTILISYRILSIDRSNRKLVGEDRESRSLYYHALEIVIESAALYSIAELALLILLVRALPTYKFAQDVVAQVTGLAPTLILARISLGLARPSSSWIQTNSTGPMRFAVPTSTQLGTRSEFASRQDRSLAHDQSDSSETVGHKHSHQSISFA